MKVLKQDIKTIVKKLELSAVEEVLLIQYYSLASHESQLDLSTSAIELILEKAYYQVKKQLRKEIVNQLWEHGSKTLWEHIIDAKPIDISYFNDGSKNIILNIDLRLGSYTHVKSDDPKAKIAKRLGATITA